MGQTSSGNERPEEAKSAAAAHDDNDNDNDNDDSDNNMSADESDAFAAEALHSMSSFENSFVSRSRISEKNTRATSDPLLGLNREGSLRGNMFSGSRLANQSLNPLNIVDTQQFHASWSNADNDDLLDLSSSVGFSPMSHQSATLLVERPSTLSRTGSVTMRASTIGEEPGVSSMIHDAARITNWQTVKGLCEEYPEAARFVGRDRWTALHHVCNRRCPHADVVEALIKAYPDALLCEEDKGWLPLHYACRFKATKDVVRLLLQLYPEKGRTAVTRLDRQGRTPLYYAVRYDAPPGVVGLLLEVDASAVLEEDQNADSPLALVWDAWAEKLDGTRTLQRIYVPNSEAQAMGLEERAKYVRRRLEGQIRVQERWTKVNLFLKAAFGFSVDDDAKAKDCESEGKKGPAGQSVSERKWRILHATSAIKCHPSLFLLACALHPEQAFESDEQDLKVPSRICGGCNEGSNVTALHFAAASQANGETARIIINQLISLNPDAATTMDSTGCLPLHRIAGNTEKCYWTHDGAKELYLANTRGVFAPDHIGRLPLHCAANAIAHRGAIDESAASESIICNLLEANGDGASHADILGHLPLHIIAENGQTWDYQAQAVCDAFRNAARARTGVKAGNRLPLHMAAANPKAQDSLISHLVSLHPRGASQADRRGKLPLHLACEVGLPWKAVEPIYNAFPAAAEQPEGNERGWNVLHLAAKSVGADAELFSNLISVCREASSVPDSCGRFPLHLACLSGKSWDDGVSLLFDAHPGALRFPDNLGLLPFHIACFRYCAVPTDDLPRPSAVEVNGRRFSKAGSHEVTEKANLKEAEDTKEIDLLFQLLKADPTILY
jgi:ankyrin repeat protein